MAGETWNSISSRKRNPDRSLLEYLGFCRRRYIWHDSAIARPKVREDANDKGIKPYEDLPR